CIRSLMDERTVWRQLNTRFECFVYLIIPLHILRIRSADVNWFHSYGNWRLLHRSIPSRYTLESEEFRKLNIKLCRDSICTRLFCSELMLEGISVLGRRRGTLSCGTKGDQRGLVHI